MITTYLPTPLILPPTALIQLIRKIKTVLQGGNLAGRLNPISGLEKFGHQWFSNNNDPYFDVPLFISDPGWFKIALQMRIDHDSTATKFYFDLGDGFGEQSSINLTITNEQLAERYVFFPEAPDKIRFDPLTSRGLFTVDQLNIVPCIRDEAMQTVIKHLIHRHKRFQGLTVEQAIGQLEDKAQEDNLSVDQAAAGYYDATFTQQANVSGRYQKWIEEIESSQALRDQEIQQEGYRYRPLISILVPVYNPDRQHLNAMIRSVLSQSYRHWELCLVDDASTDVNIAQQLEDWAVKDSRIKVRLRAENGHISRASNDALDLATGDYCALLDHDDLLHAQALNHVVAVINKHPKARLLYSDEDKINDRGTRYEPHFKSDLNRDLLYSQNYISHLGVYDASLMREVGGFRVGFEGSQDHDLVLRCLGRLKDEEVVHIPHILYHWRATEGSTALAANEKDYTEIASIRALEDHFETAGEKVTVEKGLLANTFKCSWVLPEEKPLVSLLIPTRDGLEVLKQCVDSILDKTTYPNYEIVVLDNQSRKRVTRDYLKEIEEDDRIRVLFYNYPFNFSAINNYGALFSKGSIYGFINNDVEVINPEWLTEMVSHVLRKEIGCVGAKLYYANDTIQHAGIITGIGGIAGHSHKYFAADDPGYFSRLKLIQNYSAVTAAAMLVRKSVFLEVGGLRESLAVAFNDVDFCLKVEKAGYRNLWTPYAELYHYESISRGTDEEGEKRIRFEREHEIMREIWGARLDKDPYYNPNLTRTHENFQIALPSSRTGMGERLRKERFEL